MTKTEARRLIRRMRDGELQQDVLAEVGISYTKWKRILRDYDLSLSLKRGRPASVYTTERAMEVRKRARAGEFVSDICADLGMNYQNFRRFCRSNNIQILTKKALQENIARRDRSRTGRRAGINKAPEIREALAQGLDWREITDRFQVSPAYVKHLRGQVESGRIPERARRVQAIRLAIRDGASQEQLQQEYGLTKEEYDTYRRSIKLTRSEMKPKGRQKTVKAAKTTKATKTAKAVTAKTSAKAKPKKTVTTSKAKAAKPKARGKR
jgi:hypothetical protein